MSYLFSSLNYEEKPGHVDFDSVLVYSSLHQKEGDFEGIYNFVTVGASIEQFLSLDYVRHDVLNNVVSHPVTGERWANFLPDLKQYISLF